MGGSVFYETLRRNWRGMVYWGIGMAILGATITIIIPNIDMLKQMQSLMETMPFAIKALGMEDAAQIATPEGFIGAAYFGRIIIILAVYAVIMGLDVTANEEDQGIMDMLLSLPLPRWRLVLEKFAAHALMSIGVIAIGFVGLYLGGVSSEIKVETPKLITGSINILPSVWLMMTFTIFAATFFRRKGTATAAAVCFIMGSYVLDFISTAASESAIAQLRVVSFFTYYDNAHVLQKGPSAGNVALLLGVSAVLMMGSIWFFQRRDVGI